MADPRATARQWLADTMCADLDIDLDKPSCRRCLAKADAIVSAPGVEVCALTTSAARISPTGTLVIGPNVEMRAAILLPVEVRPAWIEDVPVDLTQYYRRVQTPEGERIAYLPPGAPIPADWTLL